MGLREWGKERRGERERVGERWGERERHGERETGTTKHSSDCMSFFFKFEKNKSKFKCNFQFHNKEERINQLEYDLEGTRADLESKLRQISDLEDSLNDVQAELAQTKDQKASAMNEVSCFVIC